QSQSSSIVSPVPSHDALQYFAPGSGLHVHGGFLHFSASAIIPSWPVDNQILNLKRWTKLSTTRALLVFAICPNSDLPDNIAGALQFNNSGGPISGRTDRSGKGNSPADSDAANHFGILGGALRLCSRKTAHCGLNQG